MKYFIPLSLLSYLLFFYACSQGAPELPEQQASQITPMYRVDNDAWNNMLSVTSSDQGMKYGKYSKYLRSQASSTFDNLKAQKDDLVFASPEGPLGKSVETNLRLSLEKTDIEDTLQYAILRNGDKCRAAGESNPLKPMTVTLINNLEMSVMVEGKSETSSFKTEQQTLAGCSCFQRMSDVEEVVVTCEGVGKIFPLKHKTFPSLIAPHFPRLEFPVLQFPRLGFPQIGFSRWEVPQFPRVEWTATPRFTHWPEWFDNRPSLFDFWFAQ